MTDASPRMFVVQVQHPCIELEGGKIIPNFKTLGTVLAEDAESALKAAQMEFVNNSPALLTVEPLED